MVQRELQFNYKVNSTPKGQLQDVLRMLIELDGVSERDTNYNGFRTRISELKNEYKLNIRTIKISFINSFGRKGYYHKHFMYTRDKEMALIIYKELNK